MSGNVRINNYIREKMQEKAQETSGLNARRIALVEAYAEFADDVRRFALKQAHLTDSDIYALTVEMDKRFPEGGHARDFIRPSIQVSTYHRVDVNLNGMSLFLWLDGHRPSQVHSYSVDTHLTERVKEWQQDKNKVRYVPYGRANIANNELAEKFLELEKEWHAIKEADEELKASLSAAIGKFGTVKTMLAAWPEAAELLPKELRPATGVALSTETLNAICGIPQGE